MHHHTHTFKVQETKHFIYTERPFKMHPPSGRMFKTPHFLYRLLLCLSLGVNTSLWILKVGLRRVPETLCCGNKIAQGILIPCQELVLFVHLVCISVYLTSKTIDSLKTPFPVLSKVEVFLQKEIYTRILNCPYAN